MHTYISFWELQEPANIADPNFFTTIGKFGGEKKKASAYAGDRTIVCSLNWEMHYFKCKLSFQYTYIIQNIFLKPNELYIKF